MLTLANCCDEQRDTGPLSFWNPQPSKKDSCVTHLHEKNVPYHEGSSRCHEHIQLGDFNLILQVRKVFPKEMMIRLRLEG